MALATEISEEESAERFHLIKYKVQEHRIGEAWKRLTEAGFKPILIKGWAVSLYYPKPWLRQFVDLDLVFEDSEFKQAEAFCKTQSFEIPVDLHCGARHLDTLPFADLFANSVLKKCGETEVRVPSEEDHLRILSVHWLNDGGADQERLWDIYYAVANRSDDFNWEKCLKVVSEKRRRWVVCAIGLAHKYLELNLKNTPLADEAKNLPGWLTASIEKEWASGVRLLPLQNFRHNRKEFWKQVKKRLPPNAVTATVLMNGDFDRYPRFIYQFGNIFTRFFPSLKRFRDAGW
jgi:hypothetical protein